jgi:hypothetical protein
MLTRHEIEILLKAGHSKIEVARLAGVSLSSVKRIAEEDSVVQVDNAAERVQRRIGRPSMSGISGKSSSRSCSRKPTCRRWRSSKSIRIGSVRRST